MFPMPFAAEPPQLSWEAQEVVREVDHHPHLVLRVTVRGGFFPHRALVPFVRIVEREQVVASAWFTETAGDSSALFAYFPTDVDGAGVIEWGYGPQVFGRASERFDPRAAKRLDRDRLGGDIVIATQQMLAAKRR
jgi:hypothetical protein